MDVDDFKDAIISKFSESLRGVEAARLTLRRPPAGGVPGEALRPGALLSSLGTAGNSEDNALVVEVEGEPRPAAAAALAPPASHPFPFPSPRLPHATAPWSRAWRRCW